MQQEKQIRTSLTLSKKCSFKGIIFLKKLMGGTATISFMGEGKGRKIDTIQTKLNPSN